MMLQRGSIWKTRIVRGVFLGVLFQGAALYAMADQPESPAKQKKLNVLFIAIDDLNDWVGCLGGHPQAITPNIDALAADGLVFEKAYCAAPLCGPSRTSLLYGVPAHVSGSYGHDSKHNPVQLMPADVQSIPMMFQKNGYHTMGAGKLF
ncbi:MAG: sulfatase-like hydrolase/transferase, partial [Pontiella sp.]|nr:sulfatase-like hydrolase/transferase [Pontiella sp.]